MTFDPSEPIFGPDVPEETREQIRQKHEYFRLTMQDHVHGVKALLDSLSDDQLDAVDTIVASVQNNPGYMAGYVRGQIAMRRWSDFSVCPCGNQHDPDKEFTASEEPDEVAAAAQALGKQLITTPDHEVVEVGSERWTELLKEYNLVAVFQDGSDTVVVYLNCLGCGQQYPSLQDRMLKPPGVRGCSGCQQKAAWG